MAALANLNGVSETLQHAIPKLPSFFQKRTLLKRTPMIVFQCNKTPQLQQQEKEEDQQNCSRRLALSLVSVALIGGVSAKSSLAEDNGYWVDGPLPVPHATNKIANEATGTRSFLKNRMFMAQIGNKGRQLRLRKYAFDLLGLEAMLDKDAWNYFRKYLNIKSTFMYYDFDTLISAAPVDQKPPLLDLANRLFDSFEKLEAAVKEHNLPKTESYYKDTAVILQEVMVKMA